MAKVVIEAEWKRKGDTYFLRCGPHGRAIANIVKRDDGFFETDTLPPSIFEGLSIAKRRAGK